jgi:hypothetical protein
MPPRQTITRGAARFLFYTKSIIVFTNGIQRETVFYNREPQVEDADILCRLMNLGAKMQADRLQAALKPYELPRE